jgi:DNA-directed RNA polymerase specialized sigma24 family protein
MSTSNLPCPSMYDSNLITDDMLEHFQYIRIVAQSHVLTSIGPIDSDDIAQEACLKFWLIYQKQTIASPKAYIRRIVLTVIADNVRKYKPHLYQALSIDEHGEILEGYLTNTDETERSNPETILERQQSLDESMDKLMSAVTELAPRQQLSTVTTLLGRVDDLLQFIGALQENNIASELAWPVERKERQCLQASFSHARRNIAHTMDIQLDEYL